MSVGTPQSDHIIMRTGTQSSPWLVTARSVVWPFGDSRSTSKYGTRSVADGWVPKMQSPTPSSTTTGGFSGSSRAGSRFGRGPGPAPLEAPAGSAPAGAPSR